MHISSAVEDYAKAIYALQERGDGCAVTTNALAERLHVTPASASAMVKKLDGIGLVTHTPYKGVQLTPKGEAIALEVIRHHRLLEAYLSESLGVPWDRVHDEAEVLEHVLSEELEELIAAKLGNPTLDPHGDPIPSRDLAIADDVGSCDLYQLEPGSSGTFVRVSDADPEMLRFLTERGIRPGARLQVLERQPFDGPLSVRVGKRVHVLGAVLARAIRVQTPP
jgi:DtxR family transcriptional regulator, Mn-dependent transcriptional regulator